MTARRSAPQRDGLGVGRPAVDIVVTNHDYADFLAHALDSALDQTFPGRVIVVDDGSGDASRDVIAAYGDRVVAILKENGGQASAVNAGFGRCEADIVLFLDADDVLEPRAAETVSALFAQHPTLARVHYPMAVIDDAGRPTGAVRPPVHLSLPAGDLARTTLRTPFDRPWAAMSGNAFGASILRRILPMPEGGAVGADWYLVHLSSLYGPVGAVPGVLARYRVHGANAYETGDSELDLDHLRATVAFAAATREHLVAHARTLGLPLHRLGMASMSDIGNRIISVRLAPESHPVPDDDRRGLLALATRACRLRSDVRWPLKAVFLAWMAAMVVVPRGVVPALAAPFLFPDRRRAINSLLGRLAVRPA